MKIEIEKFKAFNNKLIVDTKEANFVLYGENGAGKSSIYEALRIIFFKDRLIPKASTPEDQEAYEQDFWSKYNNQITNDNFILKIDGINYLDFDNSSYQVFMLSFVELKQDDLQLNEILKRYFFDISNIDEFCSSKWSSLEEKVNQSLKDFNENITITIDNEDNFKIKIKDNSRNFELKTEIKNFFNEAKLNLITLLLLFHSILLSKKNDKEKLLILDDFITSLDTSNRTYILKFLFDNFSDFKLIVFTHNISFYNLILYFANEIYKKRDDFRFANLYEINGCNKIYYKDERYSVSKIKKDYDNILDKNDISQLETIGNRIRQKFERLLYEISKSLMIGTVEESKKIIERIEQGKSVYFDFQNKKEKDANDLVDEINKVINLENPRDLQNCLQRKVNRYKSEEFKQLKQIIKELKIYQKVTMHPMSHATDYGLTSFTTTEIEETLKLLEKLEQNVKQLISNQHI